MEIKGRNVITGLPATITVSSDEIRGALAQTTNQIADAIVPCWKKRRRNWHPMFPTAALS